MAQRGHMSLPYQAQNSGTANVDHFPPKKGAYTRFDSLNYINGATAHVLYVMRPLSTPGGPGYVTLTADAAASQAVVNLSADPGDYTGSRVSDNLIAANDYCLLELDDATFQRLIVSSVSGLAITFTANLAYAASKGKRLWYFGISTDTNPFDGKAHHGIGLPASATTNYAPNNGIAQSFRMDEPMIVYDANATNAGIINTGAASYWAPHD